MQSLTASSTNRFPEGYATREGIHNGEKDDGYNAYFQCEGLPLFSRIKKMEEKLAR